MSFNLDTWTNQAGLEINLLPAHGDELGEPKPVTVGKEQGGTSIKGFFTR
jgi:hypothetical protein